MTGRRGTIGILLLVALAGCAQGAQVPPPTPSEWTCDNWRQFPLGTSGGDKALRSLAGRTGADVVDLLVRSGGSGAGRITEDTARNLVRPEQARVTRALWAQITEFCDQYPTLVPGLEVIDGVAGRTTQRILDRLEAQRRAQQAADRAAVEGTGTPSGVPQSEPQDAPSPAPQEGPTPASPEPEPTPASPEHTPAPSPSPEMICDEAAAPDRFAPGCQGQMVPAPGQ